jgi:hypothetical protein
MTTLDVGTTEELDINVEFEFDENEVHLYESKTMLVLCTGKPHEEHEHDCPSHVFYDNDVIPNECPTCGRTICTFCRLLAGNR